MLLTAKRMVHFPDDNSTQLELPRLVYFDYQRAPVTIRSETAESVQGGDDVFFRGDVQIIRSASASNAELGMFTSFLQVIPDKDLAKTDKPVRMVEGNSTASSVGLEFNNVTREIKLLSEVKASYAIPQTLRSETATFKPPIGCFAWRRSPHWSSVWVFRCWRVRNARISTSRSTSRPTASTWMMPRRKRYSSET